MQKECQQTGLPMLVELYIGMLDAKGMPADWATNVAIPILEGKGDVMNCGMYRGVKLLEHAIKVVEEVSENSCNDG